MSRQECTCICYGYVQFRVYASSAGFFYEGIEKQRYYIYVKYAATILDLTWNGYY